MQNDAPILLHRDPSSLIQQKQYKYYTLFLTAGARVSLSLTEYGH